MRASQRDQPSVWHWRPKIAGTERHFCTPPTGGIAGNGKCVYTCEIQTQIYASLLILSDHTLHCIWTGMRALTRAWPSGNTEQSALVARDSVLVPRSADCDAAALRASAAN